ncbi:hypothetical protein HID58_056163 [Brassica napus]|uniref:Uncharacterized protein n=1 Tax=Brassica napus TaxID=3708 RepID=A0ABQ8AMF2_BRANA|nr:hypothetical protein HID58_056163 [Brassica napus]
MDLIQHLLFALSLFSVSFFFGKSLLFSSKNKKRMAPMAPGAWPLFGHLTSFKSSKPTHVTFGDMAEVLGPVFAMKLGSYKVLIISSQEVAKECYTVHDKVIDRIDLTASKILGYDVSFLTFSPCGPYWKGMHLYMRWEGGAKKGVVLVDMKRALQDLVANISLMKIAGKRYFGAAPNCEAGEARRYGKLIQDYFD